jgi:hypothetical protein
VGTPRGERGWYNAQSSLTHRSNRCIWGEQPHGSIPPDPTQPPARKTDGVDDFKTLKQACSSEYQGAQGAFKDSMIH